MSEPQPPAPPSEAIRALIAKWIEAKRESAREMQAEGNSRDADTVFEVVADLEAALLQEPSK